MFKTTIASCALLLIAAAAQAQAMHHSGMNHGAHMADMLAAAEQSVALQFGSFATEFARLDEEPTRVSTLGMALPLATRLLPKATFDVREAFRIHARGLAAAASNELQRSPRDKAFTMSAELLLMQHTCHWFCRSLATASARTLMRHQTPHAQLVASVAPATRRDYEALLRG